MFNISTMNEIGVESSWKKELSVSSQSCQCDPYYTRDEGSQYPVVSSAGIQSCSIDSMSTACSGSNVQGLDSIQKQDIDPGRLYDFLKMGERVTQREIRKSIKNDDDWKHINRIHGTSEMDARCLHKIYSDHLFSGFDSGHHNLSPEVEKKECKMDGMVGYNISSLTWNSNSSMIGVSYEVNVDHSKSWCSHESFFCLWNLFRTLNHESKPSIAMVIDGCITCTSAHPNLATVYSIGTRSGKVFVVNSRFSVSRQTRTRIDQQQLVSLGLDGKIFVWLMDGSSFEEGGEDTKDLILSQAFVILIESVGLRANVVREAQQQRKGSRSYLPSSPSISSERRASVTKGAISSSSSKTESSSASELGIIASSFSREDPYNFLVGCVGGSLYLCSLDTQSGQNNAATASLRSYNALQETGKSILFNSPIRVSYVPHRNNVNSVEFSPTSRNLFLSASIDGEVRVYNLLDIKPLSVLHVESGLRSVSWPMKGHETRHSSSAAKDEPSEFETFLYCLLQNGLLASFRFSLIFPTPSSPFQPSHSSLSEENNKLHPVAQFPLPCDSDQITQDITYLSFNHFGKREGKSLISIATRRGVVSVWELL